MFLSKLKVGICNRFRFLLLPFVVLISQVTFNFEKNYPGKKQYKMWVHRVHLGFLFPLRMLLSPLKEVLEANSTFLASFHFFIYLRSLPICKIWQLENGQFSKWGVMFPRTNLAANRDKILV